MNRNHILHSTRACLLVAGFLAAAAAAGERITIDGDIQLTTKQLEWTLDGPFALRRIELVLHNPHNRPLEAQVQLPLASHERLRGYALDVEGVLRDAVPVARVRARAAFEDTVRANIDPALASKGAGNDYSIRVFPIPAGGERRLRIDVASLAERAACGWRHQLDGGLTNAAALTATITSRAPSSTGLRWQRRDGQYQSTWQIQPSSPTRSVCLPAPAGDAAFSAHFDDGLQMRWLEVPTPATQAPRRPASGQPERLEIVWDASFSMQGVDRSAELALLSDYLKGRKVEVQLTVLRETPQRRALSLQTPAQLEQLLAALVAELPDGATGLASWRPAPQVERVLLFGDAQSSLPGDVPAPSVPVYVIGQRIADPALARWLTRAGGQVLELARLTPAQALQALRLQPLLQARLGPLDGNWHLQQHATSSGALRGCHIATLPAAIPSLTLLHAGPDGSTSTRVHRSTTAQSAALAAFWCATWQAEDLQAQPQRHQQALAALGERFGVVNRESSLLVLEQDDDYVRAGILPPTADPALRARVLQRRQQQDMRKQQDWASNRAAIARGWEQRAIWWASPFPKDDPRPRWAEERKQEEARRARERREARRRGEAESALLMPTSAPPPAPMMDGGNADGSTTRIAIQLQPVLMDSPYVAQLRSAGDAAGLYQTYFDLRSQYGQSPAFHFDVAQRLFELGDPVLGWRVLSNLVELLPLEPSALRLVAYRLQEAGLQAQAIALLERLTWLAPDEPQSFRDLALALPSSDATACTRAQALLAHVVETAWSQRFADIGLIALAEHNALRVRCTSNVASPFPPELLQPLPVDLRVVLRWDLNDTDIDLHVTDPNGEEVYYSHRLSYQGGAISRDFTAGYGPEEFILRKPKPGTYEVAVNYYGSRLAKLTRGATLNLSLQTGFGTAAAHEQTINLRLLEQTGKVVVGRFTVQADGTLGLAQPGDDKTAP